MKVNYPRRFVFPFVTVVTILSGAAQAEVSDGNAEKLTSLLQERRDTLRSRVQLVKAMYSGGVRSLRFVIRAENDLLNAELQLESNLAKRIALHEELVANFKKLEGVFSAEVKRAIAEQDEHLAIKAERLEAEIRLIKERAGEP